jgi:hypothetical protein
MSGAILFALDTKDDSSIKYQTLPWRRGLVVSSPPPSEETGAMGREIESRQGIGW